MKILSKKGTILAVVILYMIIIVIWGLAFLQQAYLNKIVTGGCIRSNQAFWLAEAGIQDAVGMLTANPDLINFPTEVDFGVGAGAGKYTVELTTRAGNLYTITSTGTVGNMTRTIVSQWRNSFFSNGAAFAANTGPTAIYLSGTKCGTDSYNSGSGAYGGTNVGNNGDVQSNGGIVGTGTIDGNVSLGPTGSISGVEYTGTVSYYTSPPLPPVTIPTLDNPTALGDITTTKILTDSGDYTCSGIILTGNDETNITISAGANVRIKLTGDINMGGSANLLIDSGASLIIYTAGNIDIAGNVTMNPVDATHPGLPQNFQIYGTSTCQSISMAGNTELYSSIYAPNAALNMNGSCDLYGSFVGDSVSLNGPPMIHYDEALASIIPPGTGLGFFTRTDWREE